MRSALGLVAIADRAVGVEHLYELGRRTIWAPALVHTAIDSFKLVVIPPGSTNVFIPLLVAVSLLVPLLAFVVPCGER